MKKTIRFLWFVLIWGIWCLPNDTFAEVPGSLSLFNQTIQSGQTIERYAKDTLTTGPAYTVESGGNVKLSAGNSVALRPGTKIKGGGKLKVRVWGTDNEAPVIISSYPTNGLTAPTQGKSLSFLTTFGDKVSGISSVNLLDENGNNITSQAVISDNSIEYVISNPVDGKTYNFTLVIEDKAGNVNNVVSTFEVDTSIPVTTASIKGSRFNEPVRISLSCSEPSTIYYSTDGYPPFVGAKNTTAVKAPAENIVIVSTKKLYFFAIDTAGNIERPKSEIYLFDDIPGSLASLEGKYNTQLNQVELSWTKMPVNVNGYNIYRCLNALDRNILDASREGGYPPPKKLKYTSNTITGDMYNDTDVVPGNKYWYGITVVDEKGIEGVVSNLVPIDINASNKAQNRDEAIKRAIVWLEAAQNEKGYWGDKESIRMLATSQILNALHLTGNDTAGIRQGLYYLRGHNADNNDYLARKILTLNQFGQNTDEFVNALISKCKIDDTYIVGWGMQKRFNYDALSTALGGKAVECSKQKSFQYNGSFFTLKTHPMLISTEAGRFGWIPKKNTSIFISSFVYHLLDKHYLNEAPIFDHQWILNAQKSDGAYGNGLIDTAGVLLNLSDSNTNTAINYLISQQDINGSWNNDPYVTGLCLEALLTVKKFGEGMNYFDGSNYLSSPLIEDWRFYGKDFTISFKAKLIDDGRIYYPFCGQGSSGWAFYYYKKFDVIFFEAHDQFFFNTPNLGNLLFDGNFHQIQLKRMGTNWSIWVDGSQKSSITKNSELPNINEDIYIGRVYTDNLWNNFKGYIEVYQP